MVAQGSGAIVNCSSIGGIVGSPGRTAYSASKHAIIGLTQSAAFEYANRGIVINAVCPGMVDTPMTMRMTNNYDPEIVKRMISQAPIGRFGLRGSPANDATRASLGRKRQDSVHHGSATTKSYHGCRSCSYVQPTAQICSPK
jgi:NAD(P)-dependent dehydrogenase (short-subunit alcohol dehydrogenase family)